MAFEIVEWTGVQSRHVRKGRKAPRRSAARHKGSTESSGKSNCFSFSKKMDK